MDVRLVVAGALLLFVSSVVSMQTGAVGPRGPFTLAAVASLALATGTLLVGVVSKARPA